MVLALLLACADKTADTAVDCSVAPAVSWEGWGQGFFLTWCQACHGSDAQDRHGAPADQVFDTWADVLEREEAIRQSVLIEATMPIGGGVDEDELHQLDVLLTCAP